MTGGKYLNDLSKDKKDSLSSKTLIFSYINKDLMN